ncbi:hypothetical protein [Tenacibaculum halocynthiae]|uniref:hypothetical protein n=1 Tax=Tenacibaculum halocynthiae TaxID=1254437 RepID=UPI003D647486
MQTRDYDCYVYIASTMGFRQLNENGDTIFINKETDGYCNIYVNNIAVSFLHSMNSKQINAIHYFENNHSDIFKILIDYLSNQFKSPKNELGFKHINILDENREGYCLTEYVFLTTNKEKIKVKLIKNIIIQPSKSLFKKGFDKLNFFMKI